MGWFSGDLHGMHWWLLQTQRADVHITKDSSLFSWQLYQRNQGINKGHNPPLSQPLLSLNWQVITEKPTLRNCKNREYTTILLTTGFINFNVSSLPCQFQVALLKAQVAARPSQGSEVCSLPDYFPVQRKSKSCCKCKPLAKDEVHGSSPITKSSLGSLLSFTECRTSRAQQWRGSLQCICAYATGWDNRYSPDTSGSLSP